MTSKLRFNLISSLLLLVICVVVSCNDKEEYDPISLSYDAFGPVLDNESKLVSLPLFSESFPILINGGDGRFSITNNNESIIGYTLVGKKLTIQAISPGTGSILIKDNSGNNYTLEIRVLNNEISYIKISSYAIVKGVNIDASRKVALENKIIADAPTGVWYFGSETIKIGEPFKAKLYLTDAVDSEYKEYNSILQGEIPEGQAAPPAIQVSTWLTMKSDTEEFVLYICQPFELDNGKLIKGYNFIRNVTSRYIAEYPEITQAYEVQSYYSQHD